MLIDKLKFFYPPKVSNTQLFIVLRYILWVPTRYHIYELIFTVITNLIVLFWFHTCRTNVLIPLIYLYIIWTISQCFYDQRLHIGVKAGYALTPMCNHCSWRKSDFVQILDWWQDRISEEYFLPTLWYTPLGEVN